MNEELKNYGINKTVDKIIENPELEEL